MNEEEKKAIERGKELIKETHSCWIGLSNQEAIKTVLNLSEKQKAEIEDKQDEINVLEAQRDSIENQFEQAKAEIEKKDKMIDLMAKELVKAHKWFYSEFDNYTKEDFIKYFEKKAEEEK